MNKTEEQPTIEELEKNHKMIIGLERAIRFMLIHAERGNMKRLTIAYNTLNTFDLPKSISRHMAFHYCELSEMCSKIINERKALIEREKNDE